MHAENPVWQKELIVWIISRRFQEVFKNKLDFMMLATGFKTKTQVDIIIYLLMLVGIHTFLFLECILDHNAAKNELWDHQSQWLWILPIQI